MSDDNQSESIECIRALFSWRGGFIFAFYIIFVFSFCPGVYKCISFEYSAFLCVPSETSRLGFGLTASVLLVSSGSALFCFSPRIR